MISAHMPPTISMNSTDVQKLIEGFRELFFFSAEKQIPMAMVIGVIDSLKLEMMLNQIDTYTAAQKESAGRQEHGGMQ